jgi:hypothetical protein
LSIKLGNRSDPWRLMAGFSNADRFVETPYCAVTVLWCDSV